MSVLLEDCNLITVCVGRWDSLLRVLPSWKHLFPTERIFVSIAPWELDKIPDEAYELNLIEVQHGRFSLGLWLNKAYEASLEAPAGFTWKLDVDMVLANPMELESKTRRVAPDEFILAYAVPGIVNDKPWDDRFRGRTGTVGFHTPALGEVGGYECRLHNWGLDDMVLYREWIALGWKPIVVDAFNHMQHDDFTRTKNYEIKNLRDSIDYNRKEMARFEEMSKIDPNGREKFWRDIGHRRIEP